ncbi:hypothetical protein EDD15DRAFT_2194620 [Pisolithus albus]|nr:hypothetical protein EDD15DRAFT_2194620 [Pisolithus albus]
MTPPAEDEPTSARQPPPFASTRWRKLLTRWSRRRPEQVTRNILSRVERVDKELSMPAKLWINFQVRVGDANGRKADGRRGCRHVPKSLSGSGSGFRRPGPSDPPPSPSRRPLSFKTLRKPSCVRSPPAYLREGVRIGDVGIVTPNGNSDVFFNICLPGSHPLHGVPDGFRYHGYRSEPKVSVAFQALVCWGLTCDRSIVTVKGDETKSFVKAAILALPSGADKHDLLDTSISQKAAIRMGKTRYEFVLKTLGRAAMGHDSLYLITGYHKASTWTLAAFDNPNANWTVDVQYTGNGDVIVTGP